MKVLGQGRWAGEVPSLLLRLLSLAHGRPCLHITLLLPWSVPRVPLLIRTPFPAELALSLMTSHDLHHLCKDPISQHSHRLRTQTSAGGGGGHTVPPGVLGKSRALCGALRIRG